MLPAISADLPAYLLPPSRGGDGRRTETDESQFGPAARVDVSSAEAVAVQSQQPATGLYGPDGQFVETAGRRETQDRPADDQAARADVASQVRSADPEPNQVVSEKVAPEPDREVRAEIATERADHAERSRDLRLAEFNTIIPPAMREELDSLANRVGDSSQDSNRRREDYQKIADLMTRIGRHDEAMRALAKADELERLNQERLTDHAPSVLADRLEQEAEAQATEDTEGPEK
jgi:hypothetical protein